MVTHDDVRRIALELPESYEQPHRRAPAFWVHRRIFCLFPRAAMAMWEGAGLVIKLEREDQLNLLAGHPGVLAPAGAYSHHGWTAVNLAQADDALMRMLLRLAWTHVAPKRLSKERP